MSGESWAALAACGFAAYYVTTKRALLAGSVLGGVMLSLCGACAVLGLAVAVSTPAAMSLTALALFVAAGLVASGVGTWASISGVDRLGPITSVPIETGTHPTAALVLGGLVLGESVTRAQLLGILAIVIGGSVLTRALIGSSGRESVIDSALAHRRMGTARSISAPVAIVLPVLAGTCYAGSDLLSKVALDETPEPLLGALVNTAAGLAGWIVIWALFPPLRRSISFGAAHLFLLGGGLLGLGLLALYRALEVADVSIVAAIIGVQPLIVLALSVAVLRDVERVRACSVLAGSIVVLGTILVVT